MEQKLVFSKNGNIYLDTCMTQSAFSKARLSTRLTERGFLAAKKDDGWSFSEWFFTGTKLEEKDSVLLEGAGFSGLTLKDFFETQDNTRQYFSTALVCSAIESAIEQKVPLNAIGAGGIIISSEFERIIFLPFNLYETATQCAGKETYAQSEGMYINKTLKRTEALRFTQAVITYKVLTGSLPFTQMEQELREEDYKDSNYIPLSQKVWSLDQTLVYAVDSALRMKDAGMSFPIELLYRELGITHDGNTTSVIRKTNISNEKFEEMARKKQESFQKKLKVKRWIRHNRTLIGAVCAVTFIVLGVAGVFIHGNMQQPTTKGLTELETVEMFYSAVNAADSTAAQQSSKCKAADNIINTLSTIYVASKTRNAYNYKDKTVSPAEWFNFNYDGSYSIYGLTQFSIGTEKGSLFFEGPAKNTLPKSISSSDPDLKDKNRRNLNITYYLLYNESDGSLFAEEKEDRVTLTFLKDRWIITDIRQETLSINKVNYQEFYQDYAKTLEQNQNNILKTAQDMRRFYKWLPSNSELLEAGNRQREASLN